MVAVVAPVVAVVVTTLRWLKSLGFVGRCVYVLGLSLWTTLCLPTTPIELASGYIWPLWASTAMSVLAKTAGSLASLLLGRYLLRPLVTRLTHGRMHGHLLKELRERPLQTMSLLRAAPLPSARLLPPRPPPRL